MADPMARVVDVHVHVGARGDGQKWDELLRECRKNGIVTAVVSSLGSWEHYPGSAIVRRANEEGRAFAEYAPTPEDNHEQLKLLRECLDKLTARVRTIIDLRYHGRQSLEEIATSLSWKSASIKVALSRARRALADCVDRKLRLEEEDLR